MRHCSSCHYCVTDTRAIMLMGVFIQKCRLKKHSILHPFWSGWRCRRYRKEKK